MICQTELGSFVNGPWMGHALMMAGRLDEAMALLRRVEAGARRVELPFVEALSQAFAAQVMQRMDDRKGAMGYAAAALAFHEAFPNPIIELIARTALGRVDGSPEARGHLQRAADLARMNGFGPWLLPLLDQLGEIEAADALRREGARGGAD